jgi:hypothetical protein
MASRSKVRRIFEIASRGNAGKMQWVVAGRLAGNDSPSLGDPGQVFPHPWSGFYLQGRRVRELLETLTHLYQTSPRSPLPGLLIPTEFKNDFRAETAGLPGSRQQTRLPMTWAQPATGR